MTPSTCIPDGLFVDIRMTTVAFGLCFGKFERRMTIFTAHLLMLPNQWELCSVMIVGKRFQIHLPPFSFMAIVAIGFETFTMRRFLG